MTVVETEENENSLCHGICPTPKAETVRLSAGDIPEIGQGKEMTKGTNGIWEVTIGPIDPGAYRYNFNVDGVSVVDPRNPSTSESVANTWSLVVVPGAEFMDVREVARGAVAEVTYYSKPLNRFRRMHVYTPPGYELGRGRFPVFYLLHGAGDSDDSWTSVGRAGFILDNLIATGKDDFLIQTSRATVEMLKKHGFDVVYQETAGAHTWINWRDYLHEFAPQLFQ